VKIFHKYITPIGGIILLLIVILSGCATAKHSAVYNSPEAINDSADNVDRLQKQIKTNLNKTP
jgi:PBP1b-binding outer membrane lipoprotein LpoB